MARSTLLTLGMLAALGMSSAALVSAEQEPKTAVSALPTPPTSAELKAAHASARDLETAFMDVVDRIGPAVVTIQVEAEVKQERQMRRFFGIPPEFFGAPQKPDWNGEGEEEEDEGRMPTEPRGGSGVIISSDGYIVTNNHVVEDADSIRVLTSDDREYKAEVRGRDPESDIAVIKIEGSNLPTARWADPDSIRVGRWAMALGAPFGLDKTVTIGHVSGMGRQIGLRSIAFQDFIQTDASINPGNSGGPLVNLDGEVMGINTAILGMGTGVGFAVPGKIAQRVADQLIAEGKVSRPYLGVQVTDITREHVEALGLPEKAGALVQSVVKDTPAEKAGIVTSDVITVVGGEKVRSAQELVNTVARHRIGEKVDIELYREGKKKTVTMVTDRRPDPSAMAAVQKAKENGQLGIQLEPSTPEVNRSLGRDAKAGGVVIKGVSPYSPAQKAGLQAGDVILKVENRGVSSPEDVARTVRESTKAVVGMLVERDGGTLFIAVRKVEADKKE